MEFYFVGVCFEVKFVFDVVKELARLEYKTVLDLY